MEKKFILYQLLQIGGELLELSFRSLEVSINSISENLEFNILNKNRKSLTSRTTFNLVLKSEADEELASRD